MSINKEQIKTALAHVLHPTEKQDLISLDMIHDIIIQDKMISFNQQEQTIKMTMFRQEKYERKPSSIDNLLVKSMA